MQESELPALASKGFEHVFLLKARPIKRKQLSFQEHAKESDYAIS